MVLIARSASLRVENGIRWRPEGAGTGRGPREGNGRQKTARGTGPAWFCGTSATWKEKNVSFGGGK